MNRGDQREAIFKDDQDRQKLLGWKEQALRLLPKGHPRKVEIARRLREETTLSLKWIAARLHMGTWRYVSNLLRVPNREPSTSQGLLPWCQ
jgi:hypothetical protein